MKWFLALVTAIALSACSAEVKKVPEIISHGAMLALEATAPIDADDADAVIHYAVVTGVSCGSSADEQGVKVGDHVVTLNGEILVGKTVREYSRMLVKREVGAQLVIVIRGEIGDREVVLVNRKMMPVWGCGVRTPGKPI